MVRLFSALLLTLLTLTIPVAAEDEIFPPSEIITLTGIDVALGGLRESVSQALRQSGVPADAGLLADWERVAGTMFEPSALTARFGELVGGRLTIDEQSTLKRFYTSDFGRSVTALENDSVIGEVRGPDLEREKASLLAAAGTERLALVERILAVSSDSVSDEVAMIIKPMLFGMALALRPATGDIGFDWKELEPQLDAMMPMFIAKLGEIRRRELTYTYRSLSDAELERYVEFIETPEARRLYVVVNPALYAVMNEEFLRFGDAMASLPRTRGS